MAVTSQDAMNGTQYTRTRKHAYTEARPLGRITATAHQPRIALEAAAATVTVVVVVVAVKKVLANGGKNVGKRGTAKW